MAQPQDDIFPWSKIFDYKDELNDHFEDINERIILVANERMDQSLAEQLNKKSLVRFHSKLGKILRENNINIPQPENENGRGEQLEKILNSVLKIQNKLSQHSNMEEINTMIDKINVEV